MTMKKKIKKGKSAVKAKVSQAISSEDDIIQLILTDHQDIKKLIRQLKDDEIEFSDKKPIFEEFAPLLLSHAEPEEQSLYVRMKERGNKKVRVEGFEAQVEHTLASAMIDEIQATRNQDEWMAKCKVLAELVETHIEEEESQILKDVRKEFDQEERMQMGMHYLQLRDDFRMQGIFKKRKPGRSGSGPQKELPQYPEI
jgi:hemerythrin superfamily protein